MSNRFTGVPILPIAAEFAACCNAGARGLTRVANGASVVWARRSVISAMTLWFLLAMMTGAAVFAVLWPLGRHPAAASAGHDVRVYRDQLEEVARDQAFGRIGKEEAEAARIEVSRRLLAAAEQEPATPMASASRKRAVALAALVLLPALSVGIYLALGSPLLSSRPVMAQGEAENAQPVEQLVARVEAHLESNPQDGRGWEVLAPVYMQLGR